MHLQLSDKFKSLPENSANSADLFILQEITNNYISTDKCFYGSIYSQYKQYYNYIHEFIINYDDLTIFDIARNGYDKFLELTTKPWQINTNNDEGMYPLHLAAKRGHFTTVNLLLAKGAIVNVLNSLKQLPLHCALQKVITSNDVQIKNKKKIFYKLLNLEPNTVLEKDSKGETVFHYAVKYGFNDVLIDLNLRCEDGLKIPNNHNKLPIHVAFCDNNFEVVDLLLENHSDLINLTDGEKRSALHYAAIYGNEVVVSKCCLKSSDCNVCDAYNKSPLILAVENNNLEAMLTLLKYDVNINQQDIDGKTPLHYAVINNNVEALKILLAQPNIDLNLLDVDNKTPLNYSDSNCKQVAEMFVSTHPEFAESFNISRP